MNALQMRLKIDELNDRVKSPRFVDNKYYSAINQAIELTINDRIENIKIDKKYSLQSIQRIRDELYTLVKTGTIIIPIADVLPFPADYYYFLYLECTINGSVNYARPTDYNKIGPLKSNSFKYPSAVKPYYNEVGNGLKIDYGSGTFTIGVLDYIKLPNTVSIGNEGNKITSAGPTLNLGSNYYVYDEAVHNGITYYDGELFIATATSLLTSGTVIESINVVNCDLPELLQNEIIRMASAIMNGTVEDYSKKQDLKNDNQFS